MITLEQCLEGFASVHSHPVTTQTISATDIDRYDGVGFIDKREELVRTLRVDVVR